MSGSRTASSFTKVAFGHLVMILIVKRQGDYLSIQENDEPAQEVFPESDVNFFSRTADDLFTFEGDGQGHVTALTLHSGGKDIPIKRIE